MKKQQQDNEDAIYRKTFLQGLKIIKRRIHPSCTYLSSIKEKSGEIKVLCIINGTEWRYSTPYRLQFTKSDWAELETSITNKCLEQHVS